MFWKPTLMLGMCIGRLGSVPLLPSTRSEPNPNSLTRVGVIVRFQFICTASLTFLFDVRVADTDRGHLRVERRPEVVAVDAVASAVEVVVDARVPLEAVAERARLEAALDHHRQVARDVAGGGRPAGGAEDGAGVEYARSSRRSPSPCSVITRVPRELGKFCRAQATNSGLS